MSVDVQRLIDPEDYYLARVPLGRIRFLRALGIALFGLVTQLVTPKAAQASDISPCYGYGSCPSCSGGTCNCCGCSYTHWLGCPSGGQCWYSCDPNTHQVFRCCDWSLPDGSSCICRQYAYCCC